MTMSTAAHLPTLRAPKSYGDDDDDLVATELFVRDEPNIHHLRPVRLGDGGQLPSVEVAELTPLPRARAANVSKQARVSKAIENVFLRPRCATDPPPPWQTRVAKAPARTVRRSTQGKRTFVIPRRQASILQRASAMFVAHVTLALAIAIAVGLYCDARTRKRVAADLAQATKTAMVVIAKTAHRF